MAERQDPEALLLRARHAVEVGRHEDAIRFASSHLAGEPESIDGLCVLAQALLALDRDHEALRAARQATALAPEYEWPHRLRSHAHLALGHRREALEAAEACARLAPSLPEALFLLSEALLANGRKDEALEAAKRLRALAPDRSLSPFMLGRIALETRRWKDAEEEFRRALSIDPDWSAALNNLGIALERQGKRKEAIERLHDAARTDPTDGVVRDNLHRNVGNYLGGGLGLAIVLVWLIRAATRSLSRRYGPDGEIAGVVVAAAGVALLVALVVFAYLRRRKRIAGLHPAVAGYYADELRRARRQWPLDMAFVVTFPIGLVWALLALGGVGRPQTPLWIGIFCAWLLATVVSTFLLVRREARRRRSEK